MISKTQYLLGHAPENLSELILTLRCGSDSVRRMDLARLAVRKAPGGPRIETACLAAGLDFTESSVQRLFAEAAKRNGQTLADYLILTTEAAAECLQPSPKAEPAASDPPTPPVKLLATWREILIALGMKNNREDKQKVSRLNKTYNGPIVIPGAGKQPVADKAKLVEWWNRLEIELQDAMNQARGATADAESCHNYGKNGRVAPGVSGGVKRRRQDRKP